MLNKSGNRIMAWVAKINEIKTIPNADVIAAYRVGGWWVVDKKGLYVVGDLVVYVSIDSWIPNTLAPFLTKGDTPREYNGVKGERLRTVKLRGQLSQGLLLPLTMLNPNMGTLTDHLDNAVGFDCAELLGIQMWEAPIPASLAGEIRGLFPSAVPKTDQERVQNLTDTIGNWSELDFEVTEKLDGTSATFYMDLDGDLHVCSRNLDLKPSDGNTYWKMVEKYNLQSIPKGYAVQGEIIGEGIQGNKYKLKGQSFYVFDIYNVPAGKYLDPFMRQALCAELRLTHVPIMRQTCIAGLAVEDILMFAEGKSVLQATTEREGLVFKCKTNPDIHFKAISNKFLLKGGE